MQAPEEQVAREAMRLEFHGRASAPLSLAGTAHRAETNDNDDNSNSNSNKLFRDKAHPRITTVASRPTEATGQRRARRLRPGAATPRDSRSTSLRGVAENQKN